MLGRLKATDITLEVVDLLINTKGTFWNRVQTMGSSFARTTDGFVLLKSTLHPHFWMMVLGWVMISHWVTRTGSIHAVVLLKHFWLSLPAESVFWSLGVLGPGKEATPL